MFAIPPDLLPHPATLSHYKEVLMGNFPAYIRNSMLVTFFSCAISLALGIPAAYGFAKYATEKTKPVFAAVTAVRMVPPVAMVIPFFLIIRNIHLSDTLLGLIITYIPFELTLIIWMLKNFFDCPERGAYCFYRASGLPEPVALFQHDIGDADNDDRHAAGNEEGPVDVGKFQVLIGQQIMAGGICCDDAVRVAVQVLPLARGGVVEIQTGIGAHIQIDAHRAGEGFALVQLKLNALFTLGQHEHGIQFTGGALDVAARDLHGVLALSFSVMEALRSSMVDFPRMYNRFATSCRLSAVLSVLKATATR